MRRLTLKMIGCSAVLIADGYERSFADSGELLRRGTVKYSRLRPPLDAKLLPDDEEGEALLPDLLLGLEVV
jgi:hypothetical protein